MLYVLIKPINTKDTSLVKKLSKYSERISTAFEMSIVVDNFCNF